MGDVNHVIDIHSKSEFDTLINSHRGVMVFCSAEWCGPCKAIYPFFHKHAGEYEEYGDWMKFVKVDTDEVPGLAEELGIRSIPVFFLFEGGEKTESLSGANPPALKKIIDSAMERLKYELCDSDF
ncbi:thioredoxin-like protein [Aspergillus transmontanensis]|uniref:Thioredoxin-like protein n=1 Tax=Aspergillus transmontanensis TaxID=1034304 RepID=A0A5N6VYL4_9EURO|nr:thioredoxin-like protein [Aspergillus transmontanensis]